MAGSPPMSWIIVAPSPAAWPIAISQSLSVIEP